MDLDNQTYPCPVELNQEVRYVPGWLGCDLVWKMPPAWYLRCYRAVSGLKEMSKTLKGLKLATVSQINM